MAPTRDHEMAELRAELRALRQPQANVTVPQVAPTSDKEMAELRAELRRLRERPPQAVPQQASPQGNELAELRAELRAQRQRPAQQAPPRDSELAELRAELQALRQPPRQVAPGGFPPRHCGWDARRAPSAAAVSRTSGRWRRGVRFARRHPSAEATPTGCRGERGPATALGLRYRPSCYSSAKSLPGAADSVSGCCESSSTGAA